MREYGMLADMLRMGDLLIEALERQALAAVTSRCVLVVAYC